MFGASKTTFGSPSNSTFGQASNTLFGASAKPTGTVFGQSVMGIGGGTTSLFGGATSQSSGMTWGAGNSATAAAAAGGTSVVFNPLITTDNTLRNSQNTQLTAKLMCITAMKEYQDKSIEELRWEDYLLNRQSGAGSTAGTTSLLNTSGAVKPFQFGATQANSTPSIFGQTSKPTNGLFGGSNMSFGSSTQSVFGQQTQSQGSLLGIKPTFGATAQSTGLFGTASTSQAKPFGFGQTTQTNSLFGSKPLFGATSSGISGSTGPFGVPQANTSTLSTGFSFGQVQPQQQTGVLGGGTNLFGQPTASSAVSKPSLFGSQPATGTALTFGSNTTNIFGAPKTTAGNTTFFGASAAPTQPTGFSFGGTATSGNTGLFGAPAAPTGTTGIFGATASNTSTGFGFGTNLSTNQVPSFGNLGTTPGTSGIGLFGQSTPKKPFGFGTSIAATTTSSMPGMTGFGQATQPTGLFGQPAASTGGLGGLGLSTSAPGGLFGQQSAFGLGQKPAAPGFSNTFGLGGTTGFGTSALGGTTGNLFGGSSLASSVSNQPLGIGFGTSSLLQPNQIGASATGFSGNTAELLAQNIRAQQQVLELVRSVPYGQSSLFRYINMSSPSDTDGEHMNKSSTASGALSTSAALSTNVIPAKSAASALAERHKAAGLVLGPASPNTSGSSVSNTWLRRPAAPGRFLHVSNRSKLFSGLYEDDAFESPETNRSTGPRVRHSFALGSDASALDSPGLAAKGGFFVKRDEWKRLNLPENVRSSILERSALSSQELSNLAEASLCEDHGDLVTKASSATPANLTERASQSPTGSAGDRESQQSSAPFTQADSKLPSSRSDFPPGIDHTLPSIRDPSRRNGLGIMRARDALRATASEDSVLQDDLESTWTSPADLTAPDLSCLESKTPSPGPIKSVASTKSQASKYPIRLSKPGYYTLPTIDELKSTFDTDGRCVVEDFVIGRRHYGHILFPGLTDVTDLDLDNIVHIRRREVVIYPDDDVKPAVGCGLNKRAEICLESIWPTDKTSREPIKSPERLILMNFEQRLERATRRMDARFIEYRPESGSWVFEVKHFSKYRLEDSDDDECVPEAPTKPNASCDLLTSAEIQSSVTDLSESRYSNKAPSQAKTVSDLIMEADSDGHFGTADSSQMELTNVFSPKHRNSYLPISGETVGHSLAPTLAVKQLRDAFFKHTGVDKEQTVRNNWFSRTRKVESDDEFSDLEADDEFEANRVGMGSKRHPSSPLLHNSFGDVTVEDSICGQMSGPTPEKVTRTRQGFSVYPTKFEPMNDGDGRLSDSESDAALLVKTPFRPIPAERISEGVPLSQKNVPPVTSQLHLARLPVALKHAGGDFSAADVRLTGLTYPYTCLSQLLSQDADPSKRVDDFRLTTTSETACKTLSGLLLDACLWRGHGMRSCLTQARLCDVHATVLLTAGLPTYREQPTGLSYVDGGFPVAIEIWPSFVEKADEDLLNAAMLTSNLLTTNTCDSVDPTLSPPLDHCPQWTPVLGLIPLEAYARVLQCNPLKSVPTSDTEQDTPRVCVMRRLISLCLALWGRHPQEVTAEALSNTITEANKYVEESDGDEPLSNSVENKNEVDPAVPFSTMDFEEESFVNGTSVTAIDSNLSALRKLARKQALSEWVRSQSQSWLEAKLTSLSMLSVCKQAHPTPAPGHPLKNSPIDSVGEAIFACLVAGEPGAACRLAVAAFMPGIASLIAQSPAGDPVVRRGLQHQLIAWHQLQYDQHIPLVILRIYSLLAGQPNFPHPKLKSTSVLVLEKLDWIRVLGSYIWYFTPYDANVADVLDAYSMAWHARNDPAIKTMLARPVPPRHCDLLEPCLTGVMPDDFPVPHPPEHHEKDSYWPRDCAYHLLQLFRKRTHNLERTLDPCSISQRRSVSEYTCVGDPTSLIDWAPSWNLWRVLHALGYQHFSNIEAPSRICTEFAAQLEDGGLWEWAIFVLLHQRNQNSRDASVKAVVSRHISLSVPILSSVGGSVSFTEMSSRLDSLGLVPPPPLTKTEQFIVRLGVPLRWIHEAKAILANRRFASFDRPLRFATRKGTERFSRTTKETSLRARLFAILEASHWFAAGHYDAAHKVCFEYLLPNLVLHTNLSIGQEGPKLVFAENSNLPVGRLHERLDRILSQFRALPEGRLPEKFDTSVGIYLMYSEIISLAEQLFVLCQHCPASAINSEEDVVYVPDREAQLAATLNDLQTKLDNFAECLQLMNTPNLITRVVRTEMASACVTLTSVFLAVSASDENPNVQSRTIEKLQRQLVLMSKIELPADFRLKELSALCEAKLSMGVV